MTDFSIHFGVAELSDKLPAPGCHPAMVSSARMRMGPNGKPMLQVAYILPQVSPGCDTVSEYFVLACATPHACIVSRRRLFSLFRACGFQPRYGDVLRPANLVNARLEIRLGHETHDATLQVRVLGYRAVPRTFKEIDHHHARTASSCP